MAALLALLTVGLVAAMVANPGFAAWAWARHHNILSWYVRPLFLVPFCLFAVRRSFAGISGTLFLLATSMFWFPAPAAPDPMVEAFLGIELDYLTRDWTPAKVLSTLLVPLTLGVLAAAMWRRNLRLGLATLALIAVLKVTWSVVEAGESGLAVLAPVLVGLVLCVALIGWGVGRRHRAR